MNIKIDRTQNKLFSTKFGLYKKVFSTLLLKENSKSENTIILTGTKEERKDKMFYGEYINKSHCECCGKIITPTFFRDSYGLCEKCNKELEMSLKRKIDIKNQWIFEKNRRTRNVRHMFKNLTIS